MYLQLPTAVRTYGVPWNQLMSLHPLLHLMTRANTELGFVSCLDKKLED